MRKPVNKGIKFTTKAVDRRHEELQLILVTAIMALLAALGIILFYAVLTGADIFVWNRGLAIGIYFLLTGVIWAVLIIKNY